jgi:hypothetical protein
LLSWIKTTLIEEGNISPEDLDLIAVVDTEHEVLDVIDTFYKKYSLSPNF